MAKETRASKEVKTGSEKATGRYGKSTAARKISDSRQVVISDRKAVTKVSRDEVDRLDTAVSAVRVLPEQVDSFALINRSRTGMKNAEARSLSKRLELTVRELAALLTMNERTAARRMASGELNKVESERLLLLKALAEHGLRVFEDQGKFNRWLRRPLAILQNQSPLQMLDTATGFQLVDQVLGRIEHGVYS